MELDTLTIKNFMVYGDTQTFSFKNQGLLLITGDNQDASGLTQNGVGKTGLLEGVVYALYGTLADNTGGDNVINRQIGKNMLVALTFNQNNHAYLVKRYRKDSKYKNKVLLFEDDKEITQSSVKQTNALLVEILGINKETYLNSIFFGLGRSINFAEATDKDKKTILEDIANISIYKRAQQLAKDKVKAKNDEINEANQDLTKAQYDVDSLTMLKQHEKEMHTQWVAHKQQLENNLKSSLEALNALSLPNDLAEQISALRSKIDTLQADLGTKAQTIDDPYAENIYKLTIGIDQQDQKSQEQQQLIQSTELKVKKLLDTPQAYCEYCGSLLDEQHKQQELERFNQELSQAQNFVNNYQQQRPKLVQMKANLEASQAKINQDKASQQQEIKTIQDQLQVANQELNQKLDLLSQEQSLKTTVANNQELVDNYDKAPAQTFQADELKEAKKTLKTTQKQLVTLTDQLALLKQTVEIYSDQGVKSHVLDLVMPYINARTNYYLSELTGDSISVNINTTTTAGNGNVSDKLDVEITNTAGSDDYDLNSAGERKRIDISIALALQDYVMSKTNTKTNVIAYDEVFDGLDNTGVENVISILKQRVTEIPTIVVISHNDALKEMFEHVLTITKKNGSATFENQESSSI